MARTTASRRAKGAGDAKVKELETMNAELRLTVDGLERERDFYFGKLRDIEILLQSSDGKNQEGEKEEGAATDSAEQNELVQRIFKILYATEEDFETEESTEDPLTDRQDSAAAVAPAPVETTPMVAAQ